MRWLKDAGDGAAREVEKSGGDFRMWWNTIRSWFLGWCEKGRCSRWAEMETRSAAATPEGKSWRRISAARKILHFLLFCRAVFLADLQSMIGHPQAFLMYIVIKTKSVSHKSWIETDNSRGVMLFWDQRVFRWGHFKNELFRHVFHVTGDTFFVSASWESM